MLSHIASDLHQEYLEEVFKPLDSFRTFRKKVRQFIYDVRHLVKKKNIPVERAFQIRSSKTNYGAEVIKTAKEKLGITAGGTAPVFEEVGGEKLYSIVIKYKNGTTYRKRTSRSEINRLRSNPNVSSVEMTKYGVDGLAKKDYDGDGKIKSPSKEHAGVVHNAIQRKKGGVPDGQDTRGKSSKKKLKSYGVSEGFSNWRQDLKEVIGVDDEIASRNEKQIKEKKVDNYGGGKNSVVKINPEVTEEIQILGGHIVESFELNEDYFNQVVEIASQFFYNCGLNENGVDIVIEELGKEKFTEFVFDLAEEYFLSEARTLTGKKKSPHKAGTEEIKISRKAAPGKTTKAAVAKSGTTSKMKTAERSGTIKKKDIGKAIDVDNAKKVIASAGKKQNGDKPTLASIVKRVSKGASDFSSGWKQATNPISSAATKAARAGLIKARKDIKTTGAALGRGIGTAAAVRRSGETTTSAAAKGLAAGVRRLFNREDFENWINNLIEEGYDLSDWTTEELYGEYGYLCEKAESEQQQKLFGLALSVKRGETPRSEASAEVLKIVDTMSEKKIRDFAKTKHSGIPKKVEEAIARVRPGRRAPDTELRQRETTQRQTDNARMGLGEDSDFETSNPKIADINKRIAALKVMLSKKNDPNIQRKILALDLQRQRLEAQEARNRIIANKNDNSSDERSNVEKNSYDPEGEVLDERARARRGQPRPDPSSLSHRVMMDIRNRNKEGMMTRSGRTVAQHERSRGVSGRYEPPAPKQTTPAERLERKKAQRKRAEQQAIDMYKPRAGESD